MSLRDGVSLEAPVFRSRRGRYLDPSAIFRLRQRAEHHRCSAYTVVFGAAGYQELQRGQYLSAL